MADQRRYDVIVIGAGLSGLSAAKLLQDDGLNVLVLEARDRPGGRTFTVEHDLINYVDLGGAYVGPTQNRLLRMADEFGVKTYLTNEVEDLVLYSKNQRRRFQGAFPPLGGLINTLDLNNIMRLIDRLGEQIPAEAPWRAPEADMWDRTTVQEFLDRHCWTDAVKNFAMGFVRLNVTSEPYESSLLWFLWYIKQCGGTKRIFSTSNGGQERKFIGGSQQISDKICSHLGKDKVLFQTPAIQIQQDTTSTIVTDNKGIKYESSFVISAVPVPLISKITFDPPLPPLKNQMIQRIPMGSVIKTFMYYDSPFWRENGYCGSAMILDESSMISYTLDDVKPCEGKPALMSFILADKARQLVHMSKEARKEEICNIYAKVFDTNIALKPLHYEEHNWMQEQWSGGCYTAMMPPGFLTTFGKELRAPCGRVHFAGTETATEWSGYMEGAIQAGERAAREILCRLGRIKEEEINKTEPENMTIKGKPFKSSFFERHAPSVGRLLFVLTSSASLALTCVGAYLYLKYFT